MKKLISVTLVLTMILTMCACGAKKDYRNSGTANSEAISSETTSGETAAAEAASNESTDNASEKGESESERKIQKVGVLTFLNMSEEENAKLVEAQLLTTLQLARESQAETGYNQDLIPGRDFEFAVVFYDTLDSMLMGLNAGDINSMIIYSKTAQYLCATNDNLEIRSNYDSGKELGRFASTVLEGHMSNDFAFLMLDGNEALRDEFSSAIIDMKTDGTMDRLIIEQIDAFINGGDVKPIAMPNITGADTLKVAVTGSLPPMDYVAADGTPAGFNTAVLAEISQRIGKNIEIVVVDSIGRSTALSSGTVDAVFWTRTNELSTKKSVLSEEEMEANLKERMSKMSEDELKAYNEIRELIDFDNYGTADMPEGTICTESYYSDIMVPITKKK